MGRNRMGCDAVVQPVMGRRTVMLALSGMAAFGSYAVPAGAAAHEPALADLMAADGSASALALSLTQTTIGVRGFLAPSLDGRQFALMEGSVAPCQLCGALHDAGLSLAVHTAQPALDAPVMQRVLVMGRLEAEGGLRLSDACIQAA